ncbi:MAG: helix-turn-helix transcriptional regulator [Hyphomicrobiales bacterium]|nr:helix-turn-helix transcriptional regulator [Hyphomicrobiales bacterium]
MGDQKPVGDHLRLWRQRRRMSQLDLALEAEVSTRHLSFLETGKAQPSRDMLLHLTETLAVPLRERNGILVAAGFAPVFGERRLDDPALAAARLAVETVLCGSEPSPALAVDRLWNVVSANKAATGLLRGVHPSLMEKPNALRLALHPQGVGPRIVNYAEWRAHILARLRHQIATSGDIELEALMKEVAAYPEPAQAGGRTPHTLDHAPFITPLRLRAGDAILSFMSVMTTFGTPVDITLSELAIETFFAADAQTAEALRTMAADAR